MTVDSQRQVPLGPSTQGEPHQGGRHSAEEAVACLRCSANILADANEVDCKDLAQRIEHVIGMIERGEISLDDARQELFPWESD